MSRSSTSSSSSSSTSRHNLNITGSIRRMFFSYCRKFSVVGTTVSWPDPMVPVPSCNKSLEGQHQV